MDNKFKVGKFRVTATAQLMADGRYTGVASVNWDVGDQTLDKKVTFDKSLKTEIEAIEHSAEQARASAESGKWDDWD